MPGNGIQGSCTGVCRPVGDQNNPVQVTIVVVFTCQFVSLEYSPFQVGNVVDPDLAEYTLELPAEAFVDSLRIQQHRGPAITGHDGEQVTIAHNVNKAQDKGFSQFDWFSGHGAGHVQEESDVKGRQVLHPAVQAAYCHLQGVGAFFRARTHFGDNTDGVINRRGVGEAVVVEELVGTDQGGLHVLSAHDHLAGDYRRCHGVGVVGREVLDRTFKLGTNLGVCLGFGFQADFRCGVRA